MPTANVSQSPRSESKTAHSRRRAQPRRGRQRGEGGSQPPIGLVAAFTMIRDDEETLMAPLTHALGAYPQAQRVIARLHGDSDDETHEIFADAADAVFPGSNPPASDEPFMVEEAAFYVGFATCWLLMTAVNGGGR